MTRERADSGWAWRLSWLGALGWLALAGCSLPGVGRVTLFPETAALLPDARDLRNRPPPDVPRELEEHVLPRYVVGPGDLLLVQPVNFDSPVRFPGDQKVLSDGTIDLGRFGRATVAGLTPEQIEAAVSALVHKQEPTAGPVLVRVIAPVSQVFYVLGEVNAPGMFPLAGHETVLKGILAAGGLNERASRTDIVLARPTHPHEPPVVLPVCYDQIVQKGDTATNYQLAPGDRIFVPARGFSESMLGCHHARGPCSVGKKSSGCMNAPPATLGLPGAGPE
jgi:protein involved in polysaccharide export with SLBB domain